LVSAWAQLTRNCRLKSTGPDDDGSDSDCAGTLVDGAVAVGATSLVRGDFGVALTSAGAGDNARLVP
jgi:hypothetical protein